MGALFIYLPFIVEFLNNFSVSRNSTTINSTEANSTRYDSANDTADPLMTDLIERIRTFLIFYVIFLTLSLITILVGVFIFLYLPKRLSKAICQPDPYIYQEICRKRDAVLMETDSDSDENCVVSRAGAVCEERANAFGRTVNVYFGGENGDFKSASVVNEEVNDVYAEADEIYEIADEIYEEADEVYEHTFIEMNNYMSQEAAICEQSTRESTVYEESTRDSNIYEESV